MKKLIIITVAVLVLSFGCKKDLLDQTPDGKITLEQVFQDVDRTEAYLNTTYTHIPSYFWYYSFFAFMAGATDEAHDSDVGNNIGNIAVGWNSGALSPTYNPFEAFGGQSPNQSTINRYQTFWAGIRDANVFLKFIPTAKVRSEEFRKRFTAEAKVLRAFYYWELIKQFGPMPMVDTPFDPTFDYTGLKRPTFQECVDFIVKDCEEAIAEPQLPFRITVEPERGRFTKAIAYAIKSQALLYNASPLWNPSDDRAKWQACSTASQDALSVLTTGPDRFALASNYGNLFLVQSFIGPNLASGESIFEINETSNVTFSVINSIPSKNGMFKAGSCPTQELVDSYDMRISGQPAITGYEDEDHLIPIINPTSGYNEANPYFGRDPRFYATVWHNGASYNNISGLIHTIETFNGGKDQVIKTPPNRVNTHTGYYLRKFIDPQLQSNQPHNSRWQKFRLTEIYMNIAEAENEANGPTTIAYNAINAVRSRVQMPNIPTGLTKEQFRERVRRERRVEFAIEEHRFWDVRRWKILDKTDKVVTGMEIIRNPNNSLTHKRFIVQKRAAWENKFLIFPIPLNETSIIPDFNLNQNPGW